MTEGNKELLERIMRILAQEHLISEEELIRVMALLHKEANT